MAEACSPERSAIEWTLVPSKPFSTSNSRAGSEDPCVDAQASGSAKLPRAPILAMGPMLCCPRGYRKLCPV